MDHIPAHTYKYSNGTLNDNWYEDKEAPTQQMKKDPEFRNMREREPAIVPNGHSKPLGRLKRLHNWDTSNIIPDDGFKEITSLTKTDFGEPNDKRTVEKPTPKMINDIGAMPLVEHEVSAPKTGFASVLPRHDKEHGKSYFNTTNRDYYGQPGNKEPQAVVEDFRKTETNHAGGDKWVKQEKVKPISGLTGEVFNTAHDPQVASEVQRTWIYKKDPAIEAVKSGVHEKDQTKPQDNELSLPIGDGEYAQKMRVHEPNAYRKVRTDITRKQGWKPSLVKF